MQSVEEEPHHRIKESGILRNYDFAYPWLNLIYLKLLAEEERGLRPSYTYGVLHGVYLAKMIGVERVSVIEFGVAGGNGLISLERIAEKVSEEFGIGVDVYGFDVGIGLPKPRDYRDLPNLYAEGNYHMDVEKLKNNLKNGQLILGLVEETIPKFINTKPAPITFISFDLDYYTSTVQAMKVLEAEQSLLMPRIHCYFDDITGFTFSEFTGERLAISEFNASHDLKKISPIFALRYYLPPPHNQALWPEKFYLAHIFNHNLYGLNDGLSRPFIGGFTDLKDNFKKGA